MACDLILHGGLDIVLCQYSVAIRSVAGRLAYSMGTVIRNNYFSFSALVRGW